MGHTKGPVISEEGFKVGNLTTNTEVINSSGKLMDGLVSEDSLSAITAYSATGAMLVGSPVYVSGISTVGTGNLKVAYAKADDRTKAAQFLLNTRATAAHKPVELVNTGITTHPSTLAVGTILYLSASSAGAMTNTAPTVMFAQPLGVITAKATVSLRDGKMRCLVAYSKAVNPAST